MNSLFGTLETSKLDRADVVDPTAATEDGKAADAKRTKEELDRILGVASGALALAESKADKLSSRQLEAVNSGIDANKVAKIAQNESAISAEVSRATTEEARLQALINAIKTFDAVVADSLPTPSEQYSKKLYLVPSTNPETQNVKDEFICVKIEDSWSWEQVGSTDITIGFDDKPTEGSQNAARSGGIWSWVKSLLPRWLTSDYAEPATVGSVAALETATDNLSSSVSSLQSSKIDKVKNAAPVAGNFAALTADGGINDSRMNPGDFVRSGALDGYLPLTGGVVNGVQIGVIASGFVSMNRVFSFGKPRIDLYEGHNLLESIAGIKWYYGESEDPANEIAVKGDISALSSSISGLESSVSGLASSKADKSALNAHVANTSNPHKVTAGQIGALSMSPYPAADQTFNWSSPSGGGVRLFGDYYGTGIGLSLNSVGGMLLNYHDGTEDWYHLPTGKSGTLAIVDDISSLESSKADRPALPVTAGNLAALTADGNLKDSGKRVGEFATVTNPVPFMLSINSDLIPYFSIQDKFGYKLFNVGPAGDFVFGGYNMVLSSGNASKIHYRAAGDDETDANEIAVKGEIPVISPTDPTFSSAVLAVGLNIDTNSVAVLNEIAETFGGFPLGAGETATTVGVLLAALAAAAAWLKKNKVQTLKLDDGSVETSADGGVAKLDNFFTESNSLLNARITYERNATGLKDRAFNALTFDGTEYNLSTALAAVTPTASGQPRDLLIVATATAATTISFTAGTIKGDKPTIDGSGTWLITLTEYASGVWYCRQIKMEDAA